jgi:probable F420-dependent oxidoreductase
MPPFRFGVQLSRAGSGREWRELARRVEGLGYSTLFIPDHFEDQFGPLVALTVAAEATSTLRVGSLVFGNDYRHPVLLAKEIATLDLVSEGRVEFGLGAGWMTADYAQAGLEQDPPSVRIERMAESLTVMKALWSTGTCSFAGKHYRIEGATGEPRPHRQPHPPIVIGGGGRRVLALAAREADIVGVNPNLAAGVIGPEVLEGTTPAAYDRRLEWVRAAAGERFGDLELQCLTFVVQIVPDREEAVARLAGALSVAEEHIAGTPIALIGTTEEIAETLRARRERFGFSYVVVHEAEMEAFAPVVAELGGT